jgi:hypothetical protein
MTPAKIENEGKFGSEIQCPFVYATGKRCEGEVVRIERYHVTAVWEPPTWQVGVHDVGTHFHVFCSLKGDHTGTRGRSRLRYLGTELPKELQRIVYPGEEGPQ